MKKQGFTLAEVLITLTIIGVVAVLTLPSLMTNTAEQQAKAALGKMTNTLTNAANLSAANLGFDFSSANETSDVGAAPNETTRSISNILKNTTKLSTIAAITGGPIGTNAEARFADGTSLLFNTAGLTDAQMKKQNDDHIRGVDVVFDTNGLKGPNLISNCQSKTAGITAVGDDNTPGCDTKINRVIKDRFLMRIRGDIVSPIGAASTWAMTGSTTINDQDKG